MFKVSQKVFIVIICLILLIVVVFTQYEIQLSFTLRDYDPSESMANDSPDIHPINEGQFLDQILNPKLPHGELHVSLDATERKNEEEQEAFKQLKHAYSFDNSTERNSSVHVTSHDEKTLNVLATSDEATTTTFTNSTR